MGLKKSLRTAGHHARAVKEALSELCVVAGQDRVDALGSFMILVRNLVEPTIVFKFQGQRWSIEYAFRPDNGISHERNPAVS